MVTVGASAVLSIQTASRVLLVTTVAQALYEVLEQALFTKGYRNLPIPPVDIKKDTDYNDA